MMDVHAKVLADNLASLVCMGASVVAGLARIFHAIRFFHPARYTIHSVDQNPPNFHTLQHVVPLF
jgi:hypothetical protein